MLSHESVSIEHLEAAIAINRPPTTSRQLPPPNNQIATPSAPIKYGGWTDDITAIFISILKKSNVLKRIRRAKRKPLVITSVWEKFLDNFKQHKSFKSFPEEFKRSLALSKIRNKFRKLSEECKSCRASLVADPAVKFKFKWYNEMEDIIHGGPYSHGPVISDADGYSFLPPKAVKAMKAAKAQKTS